MATQAALLAETQRLLDDTNAKRWSAADLQTYLDEAQLQANIVLGEYKTSQTVTTTGGTATYTLSTIPIGPIARIDDVNGYQLTRTTEAVLNTLMIDWAGETEIYSTQWMIGTNNFSTIRLWPTPLRDGIQYTIWAPTTPPAMSGAQATVIPEKYTRALPFYAAAKALLRDKNDRDLALSDKYMARFNEIIGG